MKTIECKIGDIFCIEDGTKLEVTKSVLNCKGCYFFNDKDKSCSRPKNIVCSAPRREDKEFVIFKQVKDNNMEEKRNIKISLEEAKEWYNSDDSFKKELALKAYKEEELVENYLSITTKIPLSEFHEIKEKARVYEQLITVAKYLYKKYEPTVVNHNYVYYLIIPKLSIPFSNKYTDYKDFTIKVTSVKPYDNIYFNSIEAAKRAIDILGNELKSLFK